ncbi:MAG TPA: protein phosphatase CheZ [Steroidobacteraceae bacterium]|jgi:chemotaxis protein CheZ|nr:protein phosphatase CheZ [Steroidobacteraceae bacterium]
MSNFQLLKLEYGACVDALSEAIHGGDENGFFTAVDHIVRMREPQTLTEIRKLTGDLQKALERFSIESRLADIAENEIPDARTRLTHVIKMTDEAAHRTLDLVERSGPLAERTAREAGALLDSLKTYRERPATGSGFEAAVRAIVAFLPVVRAVEAFLPTVRTDSEHIRKNLADVLLAQGYQDLTGQIIRSVIKLVGELEETLASLTRLSGDVVEHARLGENPDAGHGPVVPGVTRGEVASGQTDVDELLSGLGM